MSWAVAISQPLAETKAIAHAERQGFECYCPKILIRHVRKHKKFFVTQPLFPRYFFVRVNDQWQRLLGTVGVHDVIRYGERPAAITDAVVDGIKQRCDAKGFLILTPPPKFRMHQDVRIVKGPFAGLHGIYQGMRAKDRVAVLISLLGAKQRVLLAEGDLAAVE